MLYFELLHGGSFFAVHSVTGTTVNYTYPHPPVELDFVSVMSALVTHSTNQMHTRVWQFFTFVQFYFCPFTCLEV